LIAWINLHGSFSIAIVIAGFAFCHLVESHGLGDRPLLLRWATFLACCLPAMILHPYGFEPLLFAVNMARGNDWVPTITEWLPFNAKDQPIHEAGLLVFFAVLLGIRPKLSLSKIAFVIFAVHTFLLHQRFVFILTLLVPMAIIRDVVMQDFALSRAVWAMQPRDLLERSIAKRFRVALAGLAVAAAIVPVLLFRNSLEPPSRVFAGKAIQYAQDKLLPARVLNDYDFGGTLIFHGIPTFVDGRTGMLFLGKFAADVAKTETPDGASTLVRQLEDYKIGWTLLRNADARNLVLAALPEWQRVYSDSDATIYKRVAKVASDAPGIDIQAKSDAH
jgi:hypothetical protein